MALVLYDRVQQTGTANTTVSFTLSGSVIGYQSFSVVGNGNTTYYGATDTSGNWEVGVGTYATGGTLTRTTILSSSNSGSAVTFSGTVTVFVTYPSSQSVYEDASGNVSPLGTIASGTWNGSTIPVAYGGTGVTTSSGANSVVLRDANQNINFNNYTANANVVTAAAGTTVLTVASARTQLLIGSTTQTFQLPNATTVALGQSFIFVNNSSGTLTVVNNASATVEVVPSGGITQLGAVSIATSAGTWGAYSFIPAAANWGTNSLDLASTVISGGTWQGGTIQSGYGGTGLTTFAAANNALYSTSSSALAAGTLPIAAGGTGQTTAAAAFNALDPMTTTGDMIYASGTNTAARLPVGTTGQILTVASGIPSWSSPSGGASTLQTQEYTATSGQTTFAVTYTVGSIEGVYRNGIKLGTSDYTATSGTDIVLASGAVVGDLICIVSFFNVGSVTAGVNTLSFGSTGLTPSSATAGNIIVGGTLALASGGTGQTTANAAFNALAPSQTSNSGKYLTTNGTTTSWGTVDALPSQTGNTGKYLTTNGTAASWGTVDALPSQTGNTGKYLTTNGTVSSWATIASSQWVTTGSDIYYSTGSVGINTSTPGAKLDVNGASIFRGDVTPGTTATYNLGSTSLRWANIYTSDLHLNNGIGNYTIVEGEEDLFLYNNKSGKTYKFALIEVDPSTAPAKMKE